MNSKRSLVPQFWPVSLLHQSRLSSPAFKSSLRNKARNVNVVRRNWRIQFEHAFHHIDRGIDARGIDHAEWLPRNVGKCRDSFRLADGDINCNFGMILVQDITGLLRVGERVTHAMNRSG